LWNRAAATRVRQVVRRERPAVVHFHNLFPGLSPAALRAADDEGVPVVMTLHNFRLACLPATFLRDGRTCEDCLGHPLWRGVVHRCYRGSLTASAALAASMELHRRLGSFERVRRFVVLSEFMRKKLTAAGLEPGTMRVRPNFAWATRRRAGPGSYFLVLGRLSPEKGVETVLQAGKGRVRLVIAGDGPERRRLEALAPDGTEFLGAVEAVRVKALLAEARALLVPSRSFEGSPRAVIEAMAAGVPVIASDIGGIPEHVENEVSGLLVPPVEVPAWTAAIDRLCDPGLSERLGDGAYASWHARFRPEIALASLEEIYRDAIEATA
jgi:glycosyltransferase involved in cell wall biosynthesis